MNTFPLELSMQEKIDQMAVAVADEIVKEVPPDPFSTNSQISELIKNEIKKQTIQLFEKLQGGLQELGESEIDLTQLWEAFDKAPELERADLSPKDFCHVSNDRLTSFNGIAARLYEGKNYPKAASVYLLLTYLDPRQPAFWQGLGNSEYFNQNYQTAVQAYEMALEVNQEDFSSCFYSAHCHQHLNNRESAILCADQALAIINVNPDLQKWRRPAEDLKAFLSK